MGTRVHHDCTCWTEVMPFEKIPNHTDLVEFAHSAMEDALRDNPDFGYADWENGIRFPFQMTVVVKLWRTEECYWADDPPRKRVSYPWLSARRFREMQDILEFHGGG